MAQGGGGGGPITIIPQLTYVFSSPGTLTTTDNALIPWLPGRNNIVSKATAQIKTVADADVTGDVKLIDRVTGAVVSTLGTLTIPTGALVPASDLVFADTPVPDTQALAYFITQVGSAGNEGSDLTVEVFKG